MDILIYATDSNTVKDRIVTLNHGQEDFTFCGTKPTQTQYGERVFFMDRGGKVFGFSSFEKYEYTMVKSNIEGKPQEGMAIFFRGFAPLTHEIPKNLRPRYRWSYIKDELSNYL